MEDDDGDEEEDGEEEGGKEEGGKEEDKAAAEEEEDKEQHEEDEQQHEEEEEEEERKKKIHKRHRDLVLEEDDYDLLEENTGIRRQRPAERRRLKKARDIDGEENAHQFVAAEDLQADLFGPEDQEDLEDELDGAQPEAEKLKDDDGKKGEEDEDDIFDVDEDDWIVDEFEEAAEAQGGEEAAKEARKLRRKRQQAALANVPGVDIHALEEAHAIFGDVDEYLEMYERARQQREDGAGGEEGEQEEEEEEDEYGDLQPSDLEDEEAAEEMRRQRASRQKKTSKKGLHLQMDPEAAARHFLLPSDDLIRETDIPERDQIMSSILAPVNKLISDDCVEWIWRQLIFETETKARAILEDGVREVEGPPPSWIGPTWPAESLRGGLVDTSSSRGLYLGRFGSDFEAWLENGDAQLSLKNSIKSFLMYRFKENEEIPYIAMYRKDDLGELLCIRPSDEPVENTSSHPAGSIKGGDRRIKRWDILYAIQRFALKYSSMISRKNKRKEMYNQVAAESSEFDATSSTALACIQALNNATSMDVLDDIESKFKAALTINRVSDESQGKKKVQKSRFFSMAAQAGLQSALDSFCISPGDFAENVESGFKVNEPEDPGLEPSQYLEHFVDTENPVFTSTEFVIKSVVRLMAYSLSSEPAVRKAVREQFWNRGVVSTIVQQPGLSTLNAFHPLGISKRIKNKPLKSFKRKDTFLRLSAAEEEGFVKIEMEMARGEEDLEAVIAPLEDLYLSSGLSEQSQSWNDLRKQALRMAVEKYIMPSIKNEVRRRLSADGMEIVLQETTDRLWGFAIKPPVSLLDQDGDEVYDKRIMAAVYGAGDNAGPPSTLVVLDNNGSLIDFLHCPQLSGFIPKRKTIAGQTYSIFDDPKKSRDAHRIRDFIEAHLPHAIIVGMGHPEAKSLRADLSLVLERILSDNPIAMTTLETGSILQYTSDESVAMAWENSNAAELELPSSPPIIRRAVALARQALDPLAVLSSVCGQFKEITTMKLHQLEKYIPNEIKARYIDEIICTAVAQTGVDLNLAVTSTWRGYLLPFVPGLGYRKAASLAKMIVKSGGAIEQRNDLIDSGFLGRKVYHNASPFLKVQASSDAARSLIINVIDSTRIHPDDYDTAMALAKEVEGNEESSDLAVIEYATENPGKVNTVDLQAFIQKQTSEESEESLPPPSLGRLIDIQMELAYPFGEMRPQYRDLSTEEIFWLVAGEDQTTVKIGRKVEARVRYASDDAAMCNIPELNNTEAIIEAASVSSKQHVHDCRDYFKPGDTIVGVIISIDTDNSVIYLSTASTQLNSDIEFENQYLAQEEEHYMIPDKETLQEEEARRRGTKAKPQITMRPIRHPYFKNITAAEANSEVLGGPIGVAVIRPAAKSYKRLYITMCMPGGLVWNVGIREMGKPKGNLTLASPLEVEPIPGHKFEYEDLDELVVRFIDPVGAAMRALAAHRKWKGGPEMGPATSWEDIQEDLRMEKEAAPNQAAYCLAADILRPGAFFLAHHIGSVPRREYFVVLPDGFYFRKKIYGTVEHMLVQFKKNPGNMQQQQHYGSHPAPMRSQVPGAY